MAPSVPPIDKVPMSDTASRAREILHSFENAPDSDVHRQLRDLARTVAEHYRNGTAAMSPDVIDNLHPDHAIVLCLEFTAIIGPTTSDERLALMDRVVEYGFPPQFYPPGSPPPTDEDKRAAGRALMFAGEWLEMHARSPLTPIEYALDELVHWLPGFRAVAVGLSWVAAAKLPPAVPA